VCVCVCVCACAYAHTCMWKTFTYFLGTHAKSLKELHKIFLSLFEIAVCKAPGNKINIKQFTMKRFQVYY